MGHELAPHHQVGAGHTSSATRQLGHSPFPLHSQAGVGPCPLPPAGLGIPCCRVGLWPGQTPHPHGARLGLSQASFYCPAGLGLGCPPLSCVARFYHHPLKLYRNIGNDKEGRVPPLMPASLSAGFNLPLHPSTDVPMLT